MNFYFYRYGGDEKCAECEIRLGNDSWTHQGADHSPLHRECLNPEGKNITFPCPKCEDGVEFAPHFLRYWGGRFLSRCESFSYRLLRAMEVSEGMQGRWGLNSRYGLITGVALGALSIPYFQNNSTVEGVALLGASGMAIASSCAARTKRMKSFAATLLGGSVLMTGATALYSLAYSTVKQLLGTQAKLGAEIHRLRAENDRLNTELQKAKEDCRATFKDVHEKFQEIDQQNRQTVSISNRAFQLSSEALSKCKEALSKSKNALSVCQKMRSQIGELYSQCKNSLDAKMQEILDLQKSTT